MAALRSATTSTTGRGAFMSTLPSIHEYAANAVLLNALAAALVPGTFSSNSLI